MRFSVHELLWLFCKFLIFQINYEYNTKYSTCHNTTTIIIKVHYTIMYYHVYFILFKVNHQCSMYVYNVRFVCFEKKKQKKLNRKKKSFFSFVRRAVVWLYLRKYKMRYDRTQRKQKKKQPLNSKDGEDIRDKKRRKEEK